MRKILRTTIFLGILSLGASAGAAGGSHAASAGMPNPYDPSGRVATNLMPSRAPSNALSATSPRTASSLQSANTVHIADFAFNPSTITVMAGDTVTWMNTSKTTPHTTTSDAGLWDSGQLQPGASFSHAFTTAGTFSYHCMIHPFMMGTVTVMAATSAAAPRLPSTGTGGLLNQSASGGNSGKMDGLVLAMSLLLAALGLGVSGLVAYRRSR